MTSRSPVRFATLAQLAAHRDWVLEAPKDNGTIDTLCVRPEEGKRNFVASMRLDPKEGVVGDRWIRKTWMHLPDGSPDPRLQVCLLGKRVLELVRTDPETMMYPGDNIVADIDFSEANMPVGQLLQIGSAVIEVSDVFNYACSKWIERYGADSFKWINLPENKPLRLRGALAKVSQAGEVGIADRIQKLD